MIDSPNNFFFIFYFLLWSWICRFVVILAFNFVFNVAAQFIFSFTDEWWWWIFSVLKAVWFWEEMEKSNSWFFYLFLALLWRFCRSYKLSLQLIVLFVLPICKWPCIFHICLVGFFLLSLDPKKCFKSYLILNSFVFHWILSFAWRKQWQSDPFFQKFLCVRMDFGAILSSFYL